MSDLRQVVCNAKGGSAEQCRINNDCRMIDHDRVVVRRRARERFARQHSGSAGAVLHHDRLADASADRFRQQTRKVVVATARWVGNQQADRPCGIARSFGEPSMSSGRNVAKPAALAPSRARQAAATALKALAVFDVIAGADRPLIFDELAGQSGLPKATLHRMLSALQEAGLVAFNPARRTYRLGMRILDLANQLWEEVDLHGALDAELGELPKRSDETAHAAVLEGFQIAVIASGPRSTPCSSSICMVAGCPPTAPPPAK